MDERAWGEAEAFWWRVSRWDADISDEEEIQAIMRFAADAVALAVDKSEKRGDRREAEMAEQRDLAYADGDRRVAQAVKERAEQIKRLSRVLEVEQEGHAEDMAQAVQAAVAAELTRVMAIFDDYYAPDDDWANRVRAALRAPGPTA